MTDYGLDDEFVGICRGVIKRIAPAADVIDITHGSGPQLVMRGALVLAHTLPYMPVGVHLAVVDPGVGGPRRPLALRGDDGRLCEDSSGSHALAVNRASAARLLAAVVGQEITLIGEQA